MSIHFAAPWVLLFLPVGIGVLIWGARKSFVNLTAGRRQLIALLRALLVVTLTAAVARPVLIGRSRFAPVVLLVDVSDSVPEATLEAERAFVARAWAAREGRRLEVVTFAGHARRAPIGPDGPRIERHDGEDTDLGAAIGFARGLVPERAPRIALLTDGNDSHGGGLAAIEHAAAEGVAIDVVRLPVEPPPDARVVGIRMPDLLRRQQPTRLSVVVESTRAGTARLRLEENSFLVEEMDPAELKVGTQTFDFEFQPTLSGLVRFGAAVSFPGDVVPANDRFVELASVAGPPQILLVASSPEEGVHLEEALRAQEIHVEAVSPGSLPSTVEGLVSYDEVILAGIAPWEIDRLRQGALATYVRDTGGGLVFVAGRQGLRRDPDGHPSAVEALLPVELVAPSERQEPPVGMVLIIDRSGSMVGEKLGYAKQAALAVIDKLSGHDQVGVIAFDAAFDWIVPLRPLDDKAEVKGAVGSLGAGGGTKFFPALEEAYFTLGSSEATVRHAVLLTDGVSTDPDVFADLLSKMRASAITVSTVAIGHEADVKLLGTIARLGGGRFTQAARASDVPSIFVKETETIQRDAAQRADTPVRVANAARELAGIDFSTAPPLSGYIRTKAKATTEVLLETPRRDPLLVRWRYGLGQVVAFTSDATAAWAERWLTERWPGYGKLWTQIARGAQRPITRRDLTLSLRLSGARLALTAEAIDAEGRLIEDLEVRVRVIDGAQQPHEVALAPIGPGRYGGDLVVPLGNVLARPFASVGGRRLEGDWAILSRPYPREVARIGPDLSFLAAARTAGGGAEITAPEALLTPGPSRLPRTIPLFLPLTLLGLALFVLNVVARRARWEKRR